LSADLAQEASDENSGKQQQQNSGFRESRGISKTERAHVAKRRLATEVHTCLINLAFLPLALSPKETVNIQVGVLSVRSSSAVVLELPPSVTETRAKQRLQENSHASISTTMDKTHPHSTMAVAALLMRCLRPKCTV
jgi:hypothetical protein